MGGAYGGFVTTGVLAITEIDSSLRAVLPSRHVLRTLRVNT